jgi:hypothetical protein
LLLEKYIPVFETVHNISFISRVLELCSELALSEATRRNIPEDDILHSHRRENLKSYIALTGWAL